MILLSVILLLPSVKKQLATRWDHHAAVEPSGPQPPLEPPVLDGDIGVVQIPDRDLDHPKITARKLKVLQRAQQVLDPLGGGQSMGDVEPDERVLVAPVDVEDEDERVEARHLHDLGADDFPGVIILGPRLAGVQAAGAYVPAVQEGPSQLELADTLPAMWQDYFIEKQKGPRVLYVEGVSHIQDVDGLVVPASVFISSVA